MSVEELSNLNNGRLRLATLVFTRDVPSGQDSVECEIELSDPLLGSRVIIKDAPVVELGSFRDALNGPWDMQPNGAFRRTKTFSKVCEEVCEEESDLTSDLCPLTSS